MPVRRHGRAGTHPAGSAQSRRHKDKPADQQALQAHSASGLPGRQETLRRLLTTSTPQRCGTVSTCISHKNR